MPTLTRDELHALLDQLADEALVSTRPRPSATRPLAAAAAVAAMVAMGAGGVVVTRHATDGTAPANGGDSASPSPAVSATTARPAPFTLSQVSALLDLPFRPASTTDVPTNADAAIARTGDPQAQSLGLHRVGFDHADAWTGKHTWTEWHDVWVIVDRRPEQLIMTHGYDGRSQRPPARSYDSLVLWLYDAHTGEPLPALDAEERAHTPASAPDTRWIEPLVRHPAFLAAHPK